MRIISLAALTVLDLGPVGQIEAARAAGFDHVGLRLQPLVAGDRRVVGDPAAEAAVVEALADSGLRALEIGVFPIGRAPVEAWAPTLAFAQRIGARQVVCPVEDEDPARRVAALRALCARAADHGLDALIEFNPYSACRTIDDAAALMDAVARPNCLLLLDALHLSRSGGAPDDMRRLGAERFPLIHLCDAPPAPPREGLTEDELRAESRTARLPPGDGALPLVALLRALPHAAVSVEAPSAATAHLPGAERARLVRAATLRVLEAADR